MRNISFQQSLLVTAALRDRRVLALLRWAFVAISRLSRFLVSTKITYSRYRIYLCIVTQQMLHHTHYTLGFSHRWAYGRYIDNTGLTRCKWKCVDWRCIWLHYLWLSSSLNKNSSPSIFSLFVFFFFFYAIRPASIRLVCLSLVLQQHCAVCRVYT